MANQRYVARARAAWLRAQEILRTKYGTPDDVAGALKLSRQAVWKWDRVPPMQVPRVSALTGIPPHLLRPDLPELFPKP